MKIFQSFKDEAACVTIFHAGQSDRGWAGSRLLTAGRALAGSEDTG